MPSNVIMYIILVIIIVLTFITEFIIPKYLAILLVSSVLFGTFFGYLKNSLTGQETDFKLVFTLMCAYFAWFFLTKITSQSITKENVSDALQQETDEVVDESKMLVKNKGDKYKYLYVTILVILFFLLVLSLNYSYLPLSFFLFISVIFTYLTNNRLDFLERTQTISFTISFGIIFGILAPFFLFENFQFKNSITLTLIFFAWLSLSQSTSKFIQPKPQEERN